jgi:hypothetical protein
MKRPKKKLGNIWLKPKMGYVTQAIDEYWERFEGKGRVKT